ncbi:hypothetical protein [uncultured Dysgonomonas sp.]|uniref:Outer membrane protein beta-barrel domain-containing protein n=1 Tax=uncultured Dysgonomonas sp. TaxID=206096 RepID=A0A212JFQ1_9BACT|nr:hypothetical protein [uncultured Dysgonomonas sp.]SBV98231.1 conserved exported hypothetical protein [uncultured Dysgonomonas sp.]
MKNLILIALLSLSVITAKAQTKEKECKISFATTIGTGLSMSTPSKTPFTWQVLGYYNLTDRWAVGAGTGLSFYEKTLIPVFGDVKFQIGRTRKFTPYAELAMGYSFAPANDANGGYFANPSIGIQYPLKNRMRLQFAVGYEWQDLKRLKKQTDNYFHKEFEEKLWHQAISFKVGLTF